MLSDIKYIVAKTRVENWQLRADTDLESEPVMSFISSWIAFNHLYATYRILPQSQFTDWIKEQGIRGGDKAELLYFAQDNGIIELLIELKKEEALKELCINLPVKNVTRKNCVPNDIVQNIELLSLPVADLFLVIYQIRNNLFHGSKDPLKSDKDNELCECAALFLFEFNKAFIKKYF
jgi:hypothetical protein